MKLWIEFFFYITKIEYEFSLNDCADCCELICIHYKSTKIKIVRSFVPQDIFLLRLMQRSRQRTWLRIITPRFLDNFLCIPSDSSSQSSQCTWIGQCFHMLIIRHFILVNKKLQFIAFTLTGICVCFVWAWGFGCGLLTRAINSSFIVQSS